MDIALNRPSPIALWKALAAALVLALLSACAESPRGFRTEVGAPIHGDNRPHPGVAKARAMPIQGMDVARYQGRIDYSRVYASGVHFVYMKSTEGDDYVDPNFQDNWRAARAAGMAHGDVDRIVELIRRIRKGRTILMVEHNLSVVEGLCDTITVLTRGKVLAEGTYDTVSKNPEVIAAYLGTVDA